MKFSYPLFIAAGLLLLTSCQTNTSGGEHTREQQDSIEKETDTPRLPVNAPVEVAWTDLSYLKLTPEMGLAYDSLQMEDHCSSYRVTFIYAKSGADATRINNALYKQPDRNSIRKQLTQYGKDFLKSALDEMIASGDTSKPDWPFCLEESGDDALVFWNKKYICLENNSYSYMGGAHGFNGSSYTLVDVVAGRTVDPSTWIRDTTQLLGIARTLLKKYPEGAGGNPSDENLGMTLEELGFFVEGDNLPMPGSIGVCTDGVIFQYDPYEINAYAMGSYTLVLPWNTVGDAFRQDFLKP